MAGETTTRPSKSNEIYGKIKRTTQKLEISLRVFDDGPVVEIQFNWNAPCGLCSVFMVQVVMIRIVWSVCPHIQWMFVINLLFWRSALWSIFFFLFFHIIYHHFDLFLILFSSAWEFSLWLQFGISLFNKRICNSFILMRRECMRRTTIIVKIDDLKRAGERASVRSEDGKNIEEMQ